LVSCVLSSTYGDCLWHYVFDRKAAPLEPRFLATFFWEKLVRFGQIWLDLGKIKAKFGKIEAKFGQK